MFRPKNKAGRLEVRKVYLEGYTVAEHAEADCVIATAEKNGRYYLRVFDGTAAYPCINYSYGSAERRQRDIDQHLAIRTERLQAKAAQKQAKKAAGPYAVDMSKPHFEVGKTYSMEYYTDDPWPATAAIRVVKRTACFISLVHVYGSREDEEIQRVKVGADSNGEYLSFGSFYYFRATGAEEETAEAAIVPADETAEQQAEREAVEAEITEGRRYIEDVAAAHPIAEGAPVVTIRWSEHPAFYSWEDDALKLSIAAAEIILKHYDEQRAEQNAAEGRGGYDKTKFLIEYADTDGERSTYEGRYDLGDNDGGLIAHIRAFGESHRKPGYFHDEEAAREICALADLLESYTAAGRVVSVTVAPWLENAVQARREAEKAQFADTLAAVDMLTDAQLAAAVLYTPYDDPGKRDVARFFLQQLHTRDEGKALAVFKAWRAGEGIGALDDLF